MNIRYKKTLLNTSVIRCMVYVFVVSSFVNLTQAQVINLGAGSYQSGTDRGPDEPIQFTNALRNSGKPTQTNDWWTSIMWNYHDNWADINNFNYSTTMQPHPYAVECTADGLSMGYPSEHSIENGQYNANTVYVYSITGAVGNNSEVISGLKDVNFSSTSVDDYSDWDVLAHWESGNNRMRARMGHGFAFNYFTKEGSADAQITLNGGSATVAGNVLKVSINNHYYAVFAPTGSTWQGGGLSYSSSLNGKDYWSVALLPDNSESTLNAYAACAFAFITKTEVDYQINGSNVITNFNVEFDNKEGNANKTMLALYRHQWLNSSDVNTSYEYQCMRGRMKVVEGSGFSINVPRAHALPEMPLPNSHDDNRMRGLVSSFMNQDWVTWSAEPGNSYGNYNFGRALVQAGQVALIADQIGMNNERDQIVAWIRGWVEDFLKQDGTPKYIYYNTNWDCLINMSDVLQHSSENALNDHSIQFGYYVRAAAYVEHFNPGWAASGWDEVVRLYIDDVANVDRSSNMFPFMRNFDVYAGHSWASGFSNLHDGADIESTSESLNFASALLYYGQITGQQDLIDRGTWLYTNEVLGTEQYMFDVDDQVFPNDFNFTMIGLLRSGSGQYSLWWSGDAQYILGICTLPFTGGSIYLGRHPNYCKRNFEFYQQTAGGNFLTIWKNYLLPYLALYDPDNALSYFDQGAQYQGEYEAEVHSYYWINSFKDYGKLQADIASDYPSTAVFEKNGQKTYVAFIPPGDGDQEIRFSDGCTFLGPDDGIVILTNKITSTDCAGVENGTAYIDHCDECVGGTTGKDPCEKDCNGEWGGSAYLDQCQICVGGSTGKEPCTADCNGDLGGTAFEDICGLCVGGNTGKEPCLQALFETNKESAAVEEEVAFINKSKGMETAEWDFGNGATPANSSDIGPLQVRYSTAGVKTITLTVSNNFGSETYSKEITVVGKTGNCNASFATHFEESDPSNFSEGRDGDANSPTFGQTINTFSFAHENNTLKISCSDHNQYDYAELLINDGTNASSAGIVGNNRIYLKVKASGNMALRVSLKDQDGSIVQNDNLAGENNGGNTMKFDLPLSTNWQEFEIDYTNNLNDGWTNTGDFDQNNVVAILFRPNQAYGETWASLGSTTAFSGDIYIDYVILGDSSGCFTPGGEVDCHGDIGGSAFIDNCNTCVDGNTGKEHCEIDCHGDWGGTAFIDPECNECVGGNTGFDDCTNVGSIESSKPARFQIYPNPINDFLYLEGMKGALIKLVDAKGAIIKETQVSNNERIAVNDLSKGIYTLQLIKNGKIYSATFVKN